MKSIKKQDSSLVSTHDHVGHHHHQHESHNHIEENSDLEDFSISHEKHTRWVVYLTAITMIVEISFGYWTNSMALLAEGYHMASHVFVLGLAWFAYFFSRKYSQSNSFSFNKKKLLALSGFSSAIVLQIIAIIMAVESINRLLNPLTIKFEEAIIVAIIGLVVNALSAVFLHHNHDKHDHNIRSAYLHVLADGLTSIVAIIALIIGLFYKMYWLDSISGLLSSLVITKWAIQLIMSSGKDLVDYNKKKINQ